MKREKGFAIYVEGFVGLVQLVHKMIIRTNPKTTTAKA